MKDRVDIMMLVLNLDIGGQEQMIKELCKGLQRTRFVPHVVCLDQVGQLAQELESESISVVGLQKGPGIKLGVVSQLRSFIAAKNIQLIHSHNNPGLLYGAMASLLSGIPHLYTKHGIGELGWKSRLRNRLAGLTVDQLVAVSESVGRYSTGSEGLPAHKLRTIGNGIDLQSYENIPLPDPRSDAPSIGHVARLSPVKNQTLLMTLFAKFRERIPGAKLIIVGDGPEAEALAELRQKLNLQAHVELTGPRRDIPECMARFDWFALTSLSEGTPISVIEAMAAGRPITGTNVGGMSEIVSHGETGYLVDLDASDELLDHWQKLAEEPGLAAKLGAAGRQTVAERYSLSHMVDQYIESYEKLLQIH